MLLLGDAFEQPHEVGSLRRREGRTERLVVGPCYSSDVCHYLAPARRQVEGIHTPVLRVVATLDEPSLLELVHEDDEPARNDRQHRRELLLAEPRPGRDGANDPGVRARELERRELLPEPSRCVPTDLSEQEGR